MQHLPSTNNTMNFAKRSCFVVLFHVQLVPESQRRSSVCFCGVFIVGWSWRRPEQKPRCSFKRKSDYHSASRRVYTDVLRIHVEGDNRARHESVADFGSNATADTVTGDGLADCPTRPSVFPPPPPAARGANWAPSYMPCVVCSVAGVDSVCQ